MKISDYDTVLITDTHFGVRNDSPIFLDNQEQFYNEVFFPTLEKHHIKRVIHLGDMFDRRKNVNFATLARVREFFFNKLEILGIELITFVGNHDVFYKSTNDVNSIEMLLMEYKNIRMIHEPTEIALGNTSVMLCPWISQENAESDVETLKASRARVLMGHFELNGFMMHRNTIACRTGLNADVFKNYEQILSGHFHEPSSNGTVSYLGAPSQYTWSDFDCDRGFHLYNSRTLELTHVKNHHAVFHRFFLDNDFVVDGHWDFLKDKIVRVIVGEKIPADKLDFFINEIDKAGPADLEVIDNSAYHIEEDGFASEEAIATEDTVTIVESYVDSVKDEMTLDPEQLKKMFSQLHVEALALQD